MRALGRNMGLKSGFVERMELKVNISPFVKLFPSTVSAVMSTSFWSISLMRMLVTKTGRKSSTPESGVATMHRKLSMPGPSTVESLQIASKSNSNVYSGGLHAHTERVGWEVIGWRDGWFEGEVVGDLEG